MTKALIAAITEQEKRLVLPTFDEATAFDIGCALRTHALGIQAPVTIEIRSVNRRYFFTALAGSTPENQDWGRRKINTVLRNHKSSMRVGLEHAQAGVAQWPTMAMPFEDYVTAGGAFPITVRGVGVVAAIGISGLPSIEDHKISTSVLSTHLGIEDVVLPE